jgi:hypothetical protein
MRHPVREKKKGTTEENGRNLPGGFYRADAPCCSSRSDNPNLATDRHALLRATWTHSPGEGRSGDAEQPPTAALCTRGGTSRRALHDPARSTRSSIPPSHPPSLPPSRSSASPSLPVPPLLLPGTVEAPLLLTVCGGGEHQHECDYEHLQRKNKHGRERALIITRSARASIAHSRRIAARAICYIVRLSCDMLYRACTRGWYRFLRTFMSEVFDAQRRTRRLFYSSCLSSRRRGGGRPRLFASLSPCVFVFWSTKPRLSSIHHHVAATTIAFGVDYENPRHGDSGRLLSPSPPFPPFPTSCSSCSPSSSSSLARMAR